ncbi:formin-F-like isoform X2 [Mercenaria mercenaria]|uniref:formin-F-like isoform X2 n=1 Tax=Mercenaria mercenaria TaxID=6596 RepID=UPI00234F74C0|nr:formin-F-like isoform X2 [Mercenaria mercenaria]
MSKNAEYVNTRQNVPLPSIPTDDDDDVGYYNQNTSRSTMSSSDSNSSREILEGLEVINELDEVLNDESKSASGNAQRNISLSVVEKTSPMLVSPAKNRARPPAVYNMKSSFKSDDGTEAPTYDFIPEPDYSPPPSPTNRSGSEFSSGIGSLEGDKHSSGVYKQVITRRDSDNEKQVTNHRVSGNYNQVIRKEPQNTRSSGDYTKAIKPAPGAVNVMSNFTEIPKLKRIGSKDTIEKTDEVEKVSPREKSPRDSDQPEYTNNKISVKQMQANIENTYVNEVKDKPEEKSEKIPSPRDKSKSPAPAPPGQRRAPPPPPGSIPPAPPPCNAPVPPAAPPPLWHVKQTKGKLKQVHWTRTPKPLVQHSIWERPHDMTARLNLSLLEDQFSLKERDPPPSPGSKSPSVGKQQLLVDAKRAQILDIFMSGLKSEGTRKLVDVLNSVTEHDSFPAEKLTTIRRYQPTEDEIDMYKAYANKKHELHPVDQFMLELCEIPCLSIRIDICLTLWEFPWQFESTCQLVDQVHAACDELLNSQMFVLVLEYLLAIGNHLNRNWSESHVSAGFQVTSLDKILSTRGKDTGYTLIHFLVEQLRMSDPGLLQWTETVQMVKKCEQISVKSVAAESEVLKGDLSKVKRHLKTLKSQAVCCSRQDNKFQQDAQNLTIEYEMKLEKLDRRAGELHIKYRKILTRFGEPLYQKSDQMFAVVANFADKFKVAIKDLDTKTVERKSTS